MKIRSSGLRRGAGLAAATLVRNWMQTLKFEIAFCGEERNDPAKQSFQHPAIFLIWHEYLLMTLYTHGFCGIKLLVSQHNDAEWLTQAAKFLGYEAVRGSSGRGAVKALRQLMRDGQQSSVAMTPDGPLGPRRTLAQGAVFLASKIQVPIVCVGAGFDRPWRIDRAWDKFAVPRPFSRARIVVSDKIHVPKRLGRSGLELYNDYVQNTLIDCTETAESWAESGRPIANSRPFQRRPRERETPAGNTRPATLRPFQPSQRAA